MNEGAAVAGGGGDGGGLTRHLDDLAKVAAAATALAAALSGLAVTGALERAQRNEPKLMMGVFAAAIFAALLLSVAAVFRVQGTVEALLELCGIVIFAAALVAGAIGVLRTYSLSERPTITATLKGESAHQFEVKVKVGGVRSRQHVETFVDGLVAKRNADGTIYRDKHGRRSYMIAARLYDAFLGPDGSGVVDLAVPIAIPPGTYDAVGVRAGIGSKPKGCYQPVDTQEATGCVVVPLVSSGRRPRVSSAWVSAPRAAVASTVSADDLGAAGYVAARVLAIRGARRRVLDESLLAPDARGHVQRTWTTPVPQGAIICVAARIIDPRDHRWRIPECGADDPRASWVRLSAQPSSASSRKPGSKIPPAARARPVDVED